MPAILAKPLFLVLAGALLVLGIVGGGWWLHHSGYEAGRARATLEAQAATQKLSEQYRAQEAVAQQTVEANYAKYRGQVLASQSQSADLNAVASGLRSQLEKLRASGAAAKAKSASGTDGAAAPDFLGVIGACAARYESVVNYAGQLADQLTGLQGYVKAIQIQ